MTIILGKYLNKLKNITKNQPIDVWFFFLFLLTFTLSVRKVLFYFPIQGTFNEYSGIYLYLSDIFLFLAISVWLFSLLYNNIFNLSNIISFLSFFLNNKLFLFPFLLLIWSFISIFWSENETIALFRSFKLLEFYFLYIYIVLRVTPKLFHSLKNVPYLPHAPKLFHVEQFSGLQGETFNGKSVEQFDNRQESAIQYSKYKTQKSINAKKNTEKSFFRPYLIRGWDIFKKCSTWNIMLGIIIFISILHSTTGISQLISQKSVGLTLLKESILSPDSPGVAKMIIGGKKYIRAYGLFPHPNIFGGFLLFSITITFLFLKLLRACPVENCSTWNNSIYSVEQSRLTLPFLRKKTFSKEKNDKNKEYFYSTLATQIVPRGTIWDRYLKSLFAAFLFIMLFDHYFWDIQQGSFMFWILAGFLSVSKTFQNNFNLKETGAIQETINKTNTGLRYTRPVKCSMSAPCLQIVPRGTIWKFMGWNIFCRTEQSVHNDEKKFSDSYKSTLTNSSLKICPKLSFQFFWIILAIQAIMLLLTFSKSAILGGLLAISLLSYQFLKNNTLSQEHNKEIEDKKINVDINALGSIKNKNIPKQSSNKKSLFHVEQFNRFKVAFLVLFLLLFILLGLRKIDTSHFISQPINERLEYINVSRGTILSSPILGVGTGQSVLESQRFSQKVLETYEYQPVHNVFMLIWSELGIIGLVLFILFLKELIFTSQSRTR